MAEGYLYRGRYELEQYLYSPDSVLEGLLGTLVLFDLVEQSKREACSAPVNDPWQDPGNYLRYRIQRTREFPTSALPAAFGVSWPVCFSK